LSQVWIGPHPGQKTQQLGLGHGSLASRRGNGMPQSSRNAAQPPGAVAQRLRRSLGACGGGRR
jgi:hypothetical protein